jgi:hypothetical protein
MKNYPFLLLYFAILLGLGLIGCQNNPHEQEAKSIVAKWQKAHNEHQINDLQGLYAPLVVYYTKHYETSELLKSKTKYFAPKSNYSVEIIGDIRIEKPKKDVFVCLFRLKSRWQTKEVEADFALTLQEINNQLKIIEELEEITFNNQPKNQLLQKAFVANYFGGKINNKTVATNSNNPLNDAKTDEDTDEVVAQKQLIYDDAAENVVFVANRNSPTEVYKREYPFTSEQYLSKYDLAEFGMEELRIMRNEIFAWHGYIFKSEDLQKYFLQTSWYKPRFHNVSDYLSTIEKQNIKMIKATEDRLEPSFAR